MEQERKNNALEWAAQIQSGVMMKVSETEDGRISHFSAQLKIQGNPAKNDYSANEVLNYAVIQFAHQDMLHLHVF
jgi:hypothetical protein